MKSCLSLSVLSTVIVSVASQNVPADIDTVMGYNGQRLFNVPATANILNQEQCRQYGLARQTDYGGWGWRTAASYTRAKTNCYLLRRPVPNWAGNPSKTDNILGCFNPGEKMSTGCSKGPPVPSNIDTVIGYAEVLGLYFDSAPPSARITFPEACRQYALARTNLYAAWGWLANGGCLLVPTDFIGFKGDGNYGVKFGCLNPGEKMEWGCSTTEKTFQQLPAGIDIVVGFPENYLEIVPPPDEMAIDIKLPEVCRQVALYYTGIFAAWGWTAHRGCVLLRKGFTGFKGDGNSGAVFGCPKPGQKVEWGCYSRSKVTYVIGLTKEAAGNATFKQGVLSQIAKLGGTVTWQAGGMLTVDILDTEADKLNGIPGIDSVVEDFEISVLKTGR